MPCQPLLYVIEVMSAGLSLLGHSDGAVDHMADTLLVVTYRFGTKWQNVLLG